MLHPLLESLLLNVFRKFQENSGTGDFLSSELRFHGWKSKEMAWGVI
jgi:hypothetical protein